MTEKIILTISILISNRPDTVRKCLDSVQPLLHAIPSELILTDTGCGKEVRSMIEEYTDHIIEFAWCKDFAKARNAGLKQAKGQWFLFLDDDEWFEDTAEIIEFFRSGDYKQYGLGAYIQRNYLDRTGTVYTDLPVGRMVRLDKDIEFIYSIHETFNHVPGKVKKFKSYVHHYGYVYDTQEERVAHTMRNVELLLVEHDKNPRNMKHTLQLVQEYNSLGEYEKSLKLSLEGIQIAESGPIEIEFCRDSLYSNAVECYMELKRTEEAIETGEGYLEKEIDPLATAMINGILTQAYVLENEPQKALEKAEAFWRTYEAYSKDEDSFIGYVTTITSDCFEQRNRSIVLGNGIQAAAMLGKVKEVLHWFEAIDAGRADSFVSKRMVLTVVRELASAADGKEISALRKICGQLLEKAELEQYITETVLQVCGEQKQLAAFAFIQSEHWVFSMAKVASGNFQMQEIQFIERHFSESMPYMQKYHILEALEYAGYNVNQVLRKIPFYAWKQGADMNIPAMQEEDLVWWQQWISEGFQAEGKFVKDSETENLRKNVWSRAVYSRTILRAEKGPDEDTVIAALWGYSDSTITLCEHIYKPEILAGNRDILPEEEQGAYLLREVHELLEQHRLSEAVSIIRELRELLPGMASAMKVLLVKVQAGMKEAQDSSGAVQDEMQLLGAQIKEKIRQLMESGDYPSALAIADQLAAMLPDDWELKELLQELRGKRK